MVLKEQTEFQFTSSTLNCSNAGLMIFHWYLLHDLSTSSTTGLAIVSDIS
jgi:hypothetical protein